jgi:hypothetical protein
MMKKRLSHLQKQDLLHAILLLVMGVLAYLLLIKRMGFYGDDWYLIFDAHTQGPEFFKVIFSSDRPGRAYLMSFIYQLFGDHLVNYHVSAFLYRYIGALAFYWTLNMVWEQNKIPNFLMALFFLIYPGFLMQVQPVDYQSHILSVSLAMVSSALTVKAVSSNLIAQKIPFYLMAVITGWCYLALIEFHIGLEFLRLLFIVFLVWQENDLKITQRIIKTILRWLPFAFIPVGFLIWRIFIFQNTRDATDMSLQLGVLLQSPLLTGPHWVINALYGVFNTILSAWLAPFYGIVIMGGLRLRDTLLILAPGIGAVIVLLLGLREFRKDTDFQSDCSGTPWEIQAIWGGLAAAIIGFIPVIISDRTVDFDFSRYTMASAPGAVMLLVAEISLVKSRRVQLGFVSLLAFMAVTTHVGNAINAVYQAASLRDFWWQVSWRAPQVEQATTLVAAYSLMKAPEEYVIWGPANLIYYPEKQSEVPIKIQLPAALADNETVNRVLGNVLGYKLNRRGNLVNVNFGTMLVLTQPDPNGCVRILDGSMPELSLADNNSIKLISSYSQIDRILTDGAQATPPEVIFGPEPAHDWCFYYEKASLARQKGDWETVIALGEEAQRNGFSPTDRIEWMPFLQAYVATRRMDALEPYPSIMVGIPLVRSQTCKILGQTANGSHPGDLELLAYINENFCNY